MMIEFQTEMIRFLLLGLTVGFAIGYFVRSIQALLER